MTMSTKPAESPRDWPIMALSEMRAKGWTVAVHNDYRLNGQPMTFWLFTHEASERFVKGEGPTDWAAVKQALSAARRLLDAPPGVGERMREAMAAALTELENYLGDCADYEAPEGMDHLRATIEQVREALAAPAPAEPERAKHIPGTIPIYRNGRVEYVPPIEAPHVCGMSGFNPMKGDTCERCDAERFAREAPAASSAAEGSVATGEGGE
jgi:hypothetical protein